jgi:branched-subunit amino acid transport protein AzlD
MNDLHTWGMVAIIALVTALTRFLPFIIFRGDKKTPAWIERLGRSLPYAMMGMLVVYCLKDISFAALGSFAPALIACAIVTLLHLWRRSTLLSIIGGTVTYMLLVQFVFI